MKNYEIMYILRADLDEASRKEAIDALSAILTNNGAYVKYLDIHSDIYDAYPQTLYSIKPTLNLKSNVIITSGDGTLQNPFTIELAS